MKKIGEKVSEQDHSTPPGWLEELNSPDPTVRLDRIEQLLALGSASADLAHGLEQIALVELELQVREAAQALAEPDLMVA